METIPSVQNVTLKLLLMSLLIVVDLVINSFIQSSFTLSFQTYYRVNYYFLPAQMIVTALIFVMVLVMLWQTFPLRYGLISILVRQFKWTFLSTVSFVGLTALQRGIRLNQTVLKTDSYSDSLIWQYKLYVFLYYLRYLTYPFFYGSLLSFSLKVIDPSFYKPERWLK